MHRAGNQHEVADPHRSSVAEILRRAGSSAAGLDTAEAAERLRHDGPNTLPEPPRPGLATRLGKHLVQRFALLLWAGALLAALGDHFRPGEGMLLIAGALVTVVLINAFFTFWQERRAERAMAAFRNMLSPRARVLRDQVEADIDAAEVVMGDVLVLREGDRVPADARLLTIAGLKVDNSSLTGESEPQLRMVAASQGAVLDSRNLVFSGTLVTAGTGRAVVYATGGATEIGRIARATHEIRRTESPIRRELRHFIRTITAIAVGLGLFFFAIGWLVGNDSWTNLVFAIGIIVANVPEGLLPTVTLGLAIAGRKMARRNALLKVLESAETLGCTTVIGTDKTGTLTSNEMRVSDVLFGSSATACDAHDDGERLDWSIRVMALCNNATLERRGRGVRSAGDPTEQALLLHAHGIAGDRIQELRASCERSFERPFESSVRMMATLNRCEGQLWALLKGAPEVVLELCTRALEAEGSIPLDAAAGEAVRRRADALARQGRRVLALARKQVADRDDPEQAVAAGGYELLGLVAMYDPPRAEVRSAIARCHAAGIRTIVISGDHPLTVEAIAREVGIITTASPRTYTGRDLDGLSGAALRQLLTGDAEVLFARTSPLDKLRIVKALQEMGHVVAVTGDGVNDAPALKRADIGIAMGRSGTEVARAAADMVLLDDDFSTIVAAIEEGRVLYGNIRRFVGYVLTSNVPEILPYVAFVLLGIPLPLPVMLILAIDLGTDMVPAVGLATETAEQDVMLQPPRPRSQRLVSGSLLPLSYGLWGWMEAFGGFAAYFLVLGAGGWTPGQHLALTDPLHGQAIAAFFGSIVVCQIASVLIWRTTRQSLFSKGFLRNRIVLAGIAIEVAIVAFVVYAPAGQRIFGTQAVDPAVWMVAALVGLAMLALAETIKARQRHGSCSRPSP